MYAAERHEAIAGAVREHGRVSVLDLAAQFDVTGETIRRDLAALERTGHVHRVHGGAVDPGLSTLDAGERPLAQRIAEHSEAKTAIGIAAQQFLPAAGGSVFFDAGTTTYQAARAIVDPRELTIATNALGIAAALATAPAVNLHLVGGRLRGLTQASVGADTVAAIAKLRISVAFVGTNGLSMNHGCSTPDPDEAAVKSAIVASANRVVVLADSSKFGIDELVSFAPLADVDVIITDAGADAADVERFTEHGIEVVTA
ncbi:putative DeoR family transcriptional regulator [Gordonia effusa NBRC 100432]|uniref:Lactose phosphotransferase system repressor n=1 Tax=Gordonia effusa NBRC 100432 TaxID=1077974 RepID=H0QYQ1_9ACTN|nr:DeoR/GlpR family DNA-binding transcription regulator [Gordonia effusa]GAB17952.1 putative DeoR family transcriptional regulator [Gordonia effusa NBRC 100432]